MHQSGSTILLIEDDPTYIHVLEYEFSTMGWTIETVTNAEAARNYLNINKPEIIEKGNIFLNDTLYHFLNQSQ